MSKNFDPSMYPSPAERLKAVTDQLKAGVSDVFQSGKYENYLRTMSQFHNYSSGNILLIAMQFPAASQVAGFNDWKKKFGRNVKKGEKGIKILAPCVFTAMLEVEKLDPMTLLPVLDKNGDPAVERIPYDPKRFRVVTVFDISQTEGEKLPDIVSDLDGSVDRYKEISAALEKLSPYPIQFGGLPGIAKGCCNYSEQRIIIRPGMSEAQTLETKIHEIAHAKLHANQPPDVLIEIDSKNDRHSREVEAESVAYVVCQHFGVDTSDYSFGYIAGWSKGKELAELKSSLNLIRDTAAELIDGIEGREPERPRAPPRRHSPKRKHSQKVR